MDLIKPEQIRAMMAAAVESKLSQAVHDATGEAIERLVESQIQTQLAPMLGGMLEKAGPPAPGLTGAKGQLTQTTASDPKGLLYDPFTALDQMGFRERPSALTFRTLAEMARRVPPFTAYLQTRLNQMAAFCEPQPDERSVGFKFVLKDKRADLSKKLQHRADDLARWMVQMGDPELPIKRDKFGSWMRKSMWDSLVYDQFTTEIVPRKDGSAPAYLRALDAGTIRVSDTLDEVDYIDDTIQYVQIYDDTIIAEFKEHEMIFGIRNPRTDIRYSGYGMPELEMLISIVTALLWGIDYNAKFFSQGSVAKGLLNFKGAVPEKELIAFRRQWYAMVTGVQNCVAGDTPIWTRSGAQTVEGLLAGAPEKMIQVWTGTSWKEALAYRTKEPKVPVLTTLGNGASITTSPDHRFRVLGVDGMPAWKNQKDLEIGDFVLVNKQDVEVPNLPTFLGREATPDLLEVFGWITGDGYIAHEGGGHQRANYVSLFYNHDTELDIRARHLEVLSSFDAAATPKEKIVSDEDAEVLCSRYGFAEVARVRYSIDVFSVRFMEEMDRLGFSPSRKKDGGKVIPAFVHALPAEHKAAFLRGLFSADGNNARCRSPAITITNDRLRAQTRMLLLSLGVRTSLSEGKTKASFVGKQRTIVEGKSILRVKDRDLFFARIGFLQDHKDSVPLKKINEAGKSSRVALSTVRHFMSAVRRANDAAGKALLTDAERSDLNNVLCERDGCSLPRLLRFMAKAGVEAPAWLTSYNFEPVVSIEGLGDPVPMFDISVYDDEHQFMAGGVAVHNSWRTPVVNAEDVQWINMQSSNKDMEWSNWIDWLLKVTCFPSYTNVSMADGSEKRIADVRPGDIVADHLGRAHKVLNVQETFGATYLIQIDAGGKAEATPEHPFLAVRSISGESLPRSTPGGRHRQFEVPSWVKAEDLSMEMHLVVSKLPVALEPTRVIDLAAHNDPALVEMSDVSIRSAGARAVEVPRFIDIRASAFQLGLYAAEGYSSPTEGLVEFALHENEGDLAKSVAVWLAGLGMPTTGVREVANHGIKAHGRSVVIARALSSAFGATAPQRKVPAEIFSASLEAIQGFLSGVIEGDGCFHVSAMASVSITTASGRFARDLTVLLNKTGIHAPPTSSIRKGFAEASLLCDVRVTGVQLRKLAQWLQGSKGDKLRAWLGADDKRARESTVYETDEFFYVPIRSLKRTAFGGPVYNLEVEDGHTYVAEGFAVHNCAVCQIAPEEIGFQFGNAGQTSTMSEGSQADKLAQSKDKGLVPLAKFVCEQLNDKVISKLDDRFKLEFAGVNARSAEALIDLQTKEVKSVKTVDEVRKERGEDPLPDGLGDVILDPTWLQWANAKAAEKQQQQQGGGAQGYGAPPGTPQVDASAPWQDQGQGGDVDSAEQDGDDVQKSGYGLSPAQERAMRVLDLEVDV